MAFSLLEKLIIKLAKLHAFQYIHSILLQFDKSYENMIYVAGRQLYLET